MSFPLFQALRSQIFSITDSLVVDRSLNVLLVLEWRLMGWMLLAGCRPKAADKHYRKLAI